jgi:hypothetical protein
MLLGVLTTDDNVDVYLYRAEGIWNAARAAPPAPMVLGVSPWESRSLPEYF